MSEAEWPTTLPWRVVHYSDYRESVQHLRDLNLGHSLSRSSKTLSTPKHIELRNSLQFDSTISFGLHSIIKAVSAYLEILSDPLLDSLRNESSKSYQPSPEPYSHPNRVELIPLP